VSSYEVEVSAMIPARPEQVYAVLADYHTGHPAILPEPYFEELSVVEGGTGAGAIAEVQMNVYGAKRDFRLTVTEPEPGRVLVEADPAAGLVTTFTVDPVDDWEQARVTIHTAAETRPGLAGLLERLFNPGVTRRIYRAELERLAAYVTAERAE
jgi:hypothetical protein